MVDVIVWRGDELDLLDQRLLPERVSYATYRDSRDVARAIADMVVRGAPAIGIAAAYGLVLGARQAARSVKGDDSFRASLREMSDLLKAARPTAVNLAWAVDRVLSRGMAALSQGGIEEALAAMEQEAAAIEREDIEGNMAIGRHGAALILPGSAVLTHCNAGALATGGFGTALGVVRQAWKEGKIRMVYADETRPFLQGARLTAWELMQDGIPVTLIVDSAAGYLMSRGNVDAVIVGADRIARNGDVANKIGTYSLACLAATHAIPFYVAAPFSTVDLATPSGDRIPIEERNEDEVRTVMGKGIAPKDVKVWNPAFDVTPAKLVTAIITEKGVITPPFEENLVKRA